MKTETKMRVAKVGPYEIGKTYLFRGITMYQIGTVTEVHEHEIVLDPCAWVADMGRFNEALKKGKEVLLEVEPWPKEALPAIIGRGAIVDAAVWVHGVPLEVK